MRYLSVCSGIEAASVAFKPLGWTPLAFSEIEPFPRAVLKHHYPEVPLHGDFTVLKEEQWIVDADLLCGGCPCQAFSVAGLRKSLADDRGNLTLQFIKLADAIDNLRRDAGRGPAWVLYENVPGIFSTNDNAFGAFLGGLCGRDAAIDEPEDGWTRAGVVNGPTRCAAWRTLDAQHFGVAQRRHRVFVLALGGVGRWAAADALLPISESVSWHPAPSRATGQRATGTLAARTGGGGGLGTDLDLDGGVVDASVAAALRAQPNASHRGDSDTYIAHALRGEGHDASEDGTGRGTPIIPTHEVVGPLCADGETAKKHGPGGLTSMQHMLSGYIQPTTLPLTVGAQCADSEGLDGQDATTGRIFPVVMSTGQANAEVVSDGSPSLTCNHEAPILAHAFKMRAGKGVTTGERGAAPGQSGGVGYLGQDECAFTLSTREDQMIAAPVAYDITGVPANDAPGFTGGRETDIHTPLRAQPPGSSQGSTTTVVATQYAVRRLTPRECEKLQAFPPGYTMIPWRGKPAEECPDGPRYKALGNSWCSNVALWVGRRIQLVKEIAEGLPSSK